MAFVNRSGSNHIAEVLRTTGRFVGFDEMLNDVVVQNLSVKYGVKTFADYVSRVHKEQVQAVSQIWGLKAGPTQIAMLMRSKLIPHLLSPNILLVKRRDIIGQAISFYIADQTHNWTSSDDLKPKETIEYNGDKILLHLRSITNSYALLDQILAVAAFPVSMVYYEDFLDRPNDIVSTLGLTLGGQALLPRLDKLKLRQQRNDLNDEFRGRFLDDSAVMPWNGK